MLEKLEMILAWFSQRVRLIVTIKEAGLFKGTNFEASVKGLPALRGTSAHSKKGVKINVKRLRFMYPF